MFKGFCKMNLEKLYKNLKELEVYDIYYYFIISP